MYEGIENITIADSDEPILVDDLRYLIDASKLYTFLKSNNKRYENLEKINAVDYK
jgi:hypothetical protein